MKPFVEKGELTAEREPKILVGCNHLLEKLRGVLHEKFESDWEKKTGLPWREWHRWE